jgi:hypothetical protein
VIKWIRRIQRCFKRDINIRMRSQKYHFVKNANAIFCYYFFGEKKEPQPRLPLEPHLGAKSRDERDAFVPDSSTVNSEPHSSVNSFLRGLRGTSRAMGRRAKVRMDFYRLVSHCLQSLCLGWMSCSWLGKGKPENMIQDGFSG